jgi:hypothetical protein
MLGDVGALNGRARELFSGMADAQHFYARLQCLIDQYDMAGIRKLLDATR